MDEIKQAQDKRDARDFAARLMRLTPGTATGERRETTAQRDARERGRNRFNAYGCMK